MKTRAAINVELLRRSSVFLERLSVTALCGNRRFI